MAGDTHESGQRKPNQPSAPPVILDRLLADLATDPPAAEPATPPDTALEDSATEAVTSDATPPRIGTNLPRMGLTQPAKDDPAESPEKITPPPIPSPVSAAPTARKADTPGDEESSPSAIRPWVYLLLGTLNLLLLIMVLMLWQDRTRLTTHLIDPTTPGPTVPAPEAVPPGPVMDIAPAPVVAPEPEREAPPATETVAINKLVLCRNVGGFGQYEPIPDIPLTARHIPYIQAYVELIGARPEPREDQRYIYYLTKHTRLYRTDIGPGEPLMDTSVSHVISGLSPRRDFHTVQVLAPTRRVNPGKHTLEIVITDQVSGQRSSRSTTFMVHPAESR